MVAIDERIEALEAEETALGVAVRELEGQLAHDTAALEPLLARATRRGQPADIKAAQVAENDLAKVEASLRRQRAALVDCQRELTAALAEQTAAQRATLKTELLRIHGELEAAAMALDENVADMARWKRLDELVTAGNGLYRQLKRNDARHALPHLLFTEAKALRGRLLATLADRVDQALGFGKVKSFDSAVGCLDLAKTKLLILRDLGL